MKIAISGKGGTGKSTLAAAFALLLAKQGRKVLAVDADPDANLATALGITASEQRKIVPMATCVDLIEERTESKLRRYGGMFKLNPDVSDIADRFAYMHEGVALIVLGAVAQGGGGCACPESTFMRALVTDLVLHRNEVLIMDMEAGVEHLGRGTASGVDHMIVVVDPGRRAVESTQRIVRLAREIGLNDISIVANKVAGVEDEQYLRQELAEERFLGAIPFREELQRADRDGSSVLKGLPEDLADCFRAILNRLEHRT